MFFEEDRISKTPGAEPRHLQVQRILRGKVQRGVWRPGDKLPAETDIADALGVSKMTANKAILVLVVEGLLVRRVGRGTFVAPAQPSAAGDDLLSSPNNSAQTVAAAVAPLIITMLLSEPDASLLDADYYQPLYRGLSTALNRPTRDGADEVPSITVVIATGSIEEMLQSGAQNRPAAGHVLIAPRRATWPAVGALAESGALVVVVGASWQNMPPTVAMVDSDNRGGARQAVERLLELGHRRIACVYAELETTNVRDRLAGYRDALAYAGVARDEALEIEGVASWQLGGEARRRLVALLQHSERPVTALFCAGYYVALEAMKTAHAAQVRVPDNVSVIGFDNPISAWHVFPSLTTVEQPLFEMGERAGAYLRARLRSVISGGAPVEVVETSVLRDILPTRLVERNSAAAAVRQTSHL